MATADLKHPELSYRIIGCAMRVHSALGPGFPESIYHRALIQALVKEKLSFESEKSIEVFYEQALCGLFRMDLVVEGKIVLELKALETINNEHIAQALSYLKASALDLAIIINFGKRDLQTKRVVL